MREAMTMSLTTATADWFPICADVNSRMGCQFTICSLLHQTLCGILQIAFVRIVLTLEPQPEVNKEAIIKECLLPN